MIFIVEISGMMSRRMRWRVRKPVTFRAKFLPGRKSNWRRQRTNMVRVAKMDTRFGHGVAGVRNTGDRDGWIFLLIFVSMMIHILKSI
jgi:hypothetical protein